MYTATFGQDAPETLSCMNQVGAILGNAKAPECVPLFEVSAERLRATLGMDDLDTLQAVDDLAIVRWNGDRRLEGMRLWQEVLAHRQVLLGPDHSMTRKTRKELASAYRELGITDPEQVKDLQSLTTRPTTQPTETELRGEIRAALGDITGAAEDFITAIPRLQDEPWGMSPRKNACRIVAATPELFAKVSQALPDESALWVSRADWYAGRGEWAEARVDYARVIGQRGLQDELFSYGGVLLLLGDEQAYEDLCRETVERFGDPKGQHAKYVLATLCVIGPARCVDPQRVLRWAEPAAKDREPSQLETLGPALLYAGKPEQALKAFEDARRQWLSDSFCFGFARVHQALGHTEEAQDNLRRARVVFKQLGPMAPGRQANVCPTSRWIILNLMSRQTEAALSRPLTASPTTQPATAPAPH
jgi:tetratricopeptide (TPR) repeat protein